MLWKVTQVTYLSVKHGTGSNDNAHYSCLNGSSCSHVKIQRATNNQNGLNLDLIVLC